MRVFYKPDGTIYKVLRERDVLAYSDPYGETLPFIEIDEIPQNKALCLDLIIAGINTATNAELRTAIKKLAQHQKAIIKRLVQIEVG